MDDPDRFWARLEEAKIKVDPEIRRLFFDRLKESKERAKFLKALRNIVRQASLKSQERQKVYRWLAQYYNCIFQWVEEGNPGKNDDVDIRF
jgi:hypothetical protein